MEFVYDPGLAWRDVVMERQVHKLQSDGNQHFKAFEP